MNILPYALLHMEDGCGDIAFFLRRMPKRGDSVASRNAVMLNGQQPVYGTAIMCGSCGEPVRGSHLRKRFIVPTQGGDMTTTLYQLLGWIEHCEREHPDKETSIPWWLCSMDALHDAVADGYVEEIGRRPFIPRWGMSFAIYGLTKKGREKVGQGMDLATRANRKDDFLNMLGRTM